jgi:hypothetical protein
LTTSNIDRVSKRFSGVLSFLVLLFCTLPVFAGSQIEERFLNDIRTAIENKDEKAFWELFNLEGVPDDLKAIMKKHAMKPLMASEVNDIVYEPPPEGFRSEYVVDGFQYRANLKVLGRVKITYKRSAEAGVTGTSIPYGQKGDRFLFIGTTKEKLPGDLPPSKQIQVIVMGMGHPPVTFEGYMIYLQGGKPVRDKIEDMGSGNVTKIVRGEAITYLEVRRTSPKGTMKVWVMENDDTLFETEHLDTDQPIRFKK